jgi:diguanylate cyclase (GGDEF)-like protein
MLEREVYRAMRFDHPLSFLILDVDEFKSINDERGHPQGDAVLKWIADLVRESTRAIDITARYGGDEFALVLLETDEAGAQVLADRLREDVSGGRAPVGAREALQVTISVGVASVPTSATTVDGLVEAADQALLRAKREGKNRTKAAPRTASKGPEAQPGRP